MVKAGSPKFAPDVALRFKPLPDDTRLSMNDSPAIVSVRTFMDLFDETKDSPKIAPDEPTTWMFPSTVSLSEGVVDARPRFPLDVRRMRSLFRVEKAMHVFDAPPRTSITASRAADAPDLRCSDAKSSPEPASFAWMDNCPVDLMPYSASSSRPSESPMRTLP